ncbi:MAG TPA: tripartite tricarboxylate transporter substrate binding protein [Burkholderiales bacterium]|nr:tripartite tricarboxylate transporter substrate binding protein [Burkholderiales bacterium]
MRIRQSFVLALVVACALPIAQAFAQTFPTKPIRLLVGYPPGGPNDIMARALSQRLGDALGQPVIVENRPGASGNIASELVAKAQPDGYTLLMGSAGPNAINASLFPKLPFDLRTDLAPITLVAVIPNALVVNPSLDVASVQDLIRAAKAKPDKLTFASSGSGSTLHLAGELFNQLAGIRILHVPYKGTAPAMQDVMGGQVDMIFAALPSVLPQVRAGKLRMLAVTTPERSPAAPDTPTMREAGLTGYAVQPWYGLFTTGGTPEPIVERLATEVGRVLNDPKVREQLAAQGAEPQTMRPREFASFVRDEIEKWSQVVRLSGAKAE